MALVRFRFDLSTRLPNPPVLSDPWRSDSRIISGAFTNRENHFVAGSFTTLIPLSPRIAGRPNTFDVFRNSRSRWRTKLYVFPKEDLHV